MTNFGYGGCTPAYPCEYGQGGCNTDYDCTGKLICFQRSKGETFPGIDFSKVLPDLNVCVDHNPNGRKPNILFFFINFVI